MDNQLIYIYLNLGGINPHLDINKSDGYCFVGLISFPYSISIKITLVNFKW